ncbi:MAG: DUF3999 family protein [Moraxellaceae bacterium]|nr:DUF3999 family protein [Moraxellaceae bacterium]
MTRAFRPVRTLGLLCALPLLCLAQSTELAPGDFASGRKLMLTTDNAPFHRVELPSEVYVGTAWPDLRDLRVYNADGELLPHSLQAPPVTPAAAARITLQNYRVENAGTAGAQVLSVDSDGNRLSLRLTPNTTGQTQAEYLLVAAPERKEPPALRSLHLAWTPHTQNWQQRVSVDGSMDLKDWVSLAHELPLLELRNGNQQLVQGDVPLEGGHGHAYRYWRLRFVDGSPAPGLTRVQASPAVERTTTTRVEVFSGSGTTQADGSTLYVLPAVQPVSTLQISPAEPNSVFPLAIESRRAVDAPWQPLERSVAYQLLAPDGSAQASPAVTLARPVDAKEIRLRPLGPGWGANPPQLTVERDARILVFNARGRGPYLLAWGTRAATDTALPINTLVPTLADAGIDALPTAYLGEAVTLGGPERLTALAPAERSALQKKWLVWAVLIAGVLALGALAWRVWKESRAG